MTWLRNAEGLYISPEKAKSDRAHAGKRAKKHKTNNQFYSGRKLTRLCPKCAAEIKKNKRLHRNEELGIHRDETVYVCERCHNIWHSWQTIKIWQRLKQNPKKAISNKEYKQRLNAL